MLVIGLNPPLIFFKSTGLIDIAETLIATSWRFGRGFLTSNVWSFSIPPYELYPIAFILINFKTKN